jgi:phosphopantothenoylcysteine decarboxylase
MKILLGVTGSVAAKLTRKIAEKLLAAGQEVQIVATEASFYFWSERDFNPEMLERVQVWRDRDEWQGKKYDPDIPIAHIELRDWADVLLVAPLTANTLAKMANGLSDNLLTCVIRAWNPAKPVVVAPAMNTYMWFHPATAEHIKKLGQWFSFSVVEPVEKTLACGQLGKGALADIDDIVAAVTKSLDGEALTGLA